MEQRKREEFLKQQVAPVSPGGVVLGQAPTPEQQAKMQQAQAVAHCLGVAQGIYNQVVAQLLASQDGNINPLTHEKCLWLAEQCKGAAPYVAQTFGFLSISERILPSENMDAQLPAHDEDEKPGTLSETM